ncbi:hypothetical protein HSBAA_27640 [Vreelandella sulfidaeris]|uniref:Outer membrane protein beta-barrel domain-containing protein n=1 Tax=Vreelandella sulfidaeris TaxID=115553 RepID=A0A455UAX8_9GAMM|nr:hypothetical protein HSBAA_27640 [Halomonas sulfidaeris]
MSSGLSFLKTVDPAIIFANIGYTHNIKRSFDDIGSSEEDVPGEVNLGDSIRLGFGTAFALNERFSLSMSFTHQHAFETKVTTDGGLNRLSSVAVPMRPLSILVLPMACRTPRRLLRVSVSD